jgi:hypothetical protein
MRRGGNPNDITSSYNSPPPVHLHAHHPTRVIIIQKPPSVGGYICYAPFKDPDECGTDVNALKIANINCGGMDSG